MIALAAVVFAVTWPPVQGAVDVQVRNPNMGEPGCVLLKDATVRCWPSAMFVGQWRAGDWPRPPPLAGRGLAGVRGFGGPRWGLLRHGRGSWMRGRGFTGMGVTGGGRGGRAGRR